METETVHGYPRELNERLFNVDIVLGARFHSTEHFVSLSKSGHFLERHLAQARQITLVAFTAHRPHCILTDTGMPLKQLKH